VGCLFARGVYTEDNIISALSSVGIEKTREELSEIGKNLFKAKYEFKRLEGFDLTKPRISKRFFETFSTLGKVDPKTMEDMIRAYREKMGWA